MGDFRFVLLGELRRLLAEARQAEERAATPDFVSREKAELIVRRSISESVAELASYGARIGAAFPALASTVEAANALAQRIRATSDAAALVAISADISALFGSPSHPAEARPVSLQVSEQGIRVSIGAQQPAERNGPTTPFAAAVEAGRDVQFYLAAISEVIASARDAGRAPSGVEQTARAAAYQALEVGHTMPSAFRPIATSGFRKWQTSLSLADPGEGHNLVTCLDAQLLTGTVVHVEHIDRGRQTDREIVEAYRLPAPLSAARVRLQAGIAAPCTAYIGRPAFENGAAPDSATYLPLARYYDEDLLKAAHITASACSVMFGNGIADCKIAIERMSVLQAVRFMAAVAGNVSRDSSRQFLSAAFNINQPLYDDRDSAAPHWTGSRIGVAHTGIDIATMGGFDKVTWDGASNLPKSEPIIAAFTAAEWLGLIHSAHERGLETYVSAGMDRTHMAACVECAVDGVGIGTSLHYLQRTADGKIVMGELKPDAVLDVLATRDAAAVGVKGSGAGALAMLDRLAFEKLLPPRCETLRQQLYASLASADEASIEACLARLARNPFWQAMEQHKAESFNKHPAIAQAERRLISIELAAWAAPAEMSKAAAAESSQRLREAVGRGDITDILEELR
ncbi:hypothetical protein ABC969_07095 [Sphingomonas qilianensis]|uniref:Uncharacterized protein n=1 Tax=Sphingomonas qilianensis TaxID=1736690 RepID=A0ABU9XQT2_9SPHN